MPLYSVLKPATNSCSASSRSNGARLVSAKVVSKKITAPTGCKKTNQMFFWASTMAFMSSVPASSTTLTTDRPSASSYDTICAVERMLPSSAYLLLLLQPASATPYTLIDVIARTNSTPTLRCGTSVNEISSPKKLACVGPKGTTANSTSAGSTVITGARMNTTRSAPAGI